MPNHMWFHARYSLTTLPLRSIAVAAWFLAFAAPLSAQDLQPEATSSTSDAAANTQASLQSLFSGTDADAVPGQDAQESQLQSFYENRSYQPAWSGSVTASRRAAEVREVLDRADQQGLRSRDYVSALKHWDGKLTAGADAALFDVALTRALFRYAQDVGAGRTNPKRIYKDVGFQARAVEVEENLSEALTQDSLEEFLADLPPHHLGYRTLVAALAKYRAIARLGGWPAITGASNSTALAKRLAYEDPAVTANPSASDVKNALRRFQARNGLEATGSLEPQTLSVLNVTAAHRASQIAANLERWRWLPPELASRAIIVNVPDQSLEYVEDGESLLRSRVVIGKKQTPTPIMSTAVVAVVANPPWDIPDDIAEQAVLPHLRHDPRYLASHHMVLSNGPAGDPFGFTVDWKHVTKRNFQYGIQEVPGKNNVLGMLMLDSPNDFGVYLHGAANKNLFLSPMREISHGCIRVEKIYALASLVMKDNADGDDDTLSEAVASHATERLPLSEPITAYVLYWTAYVDSEGGMEFRPDRYNRDPVLIAHLSGQSEQKRTADTAVPLSQDDSPGAR